MGLCLMGWSSFLGRLERKTDRVLYQNIAELENDAVDDFEVAEWVKFDYLLKKD